MKHSAGIYFLLGVLLLVFACSGTGILNFISPHTGYSLHRDIAYGNNPHQRLDIYVPDKPAPSRPVALFFHGGSWQAGDKNQYLFIGQALASMGIITVITNYRLYPEVYFPEFMDDAARAFVWTHNNIQAYGGNPANVFLSGHSAGAHIAVMLTVNDKYLEEAHGKRSWIRGTIGIAGPYDFLPFTDPKIKALFSKADNAATQPINYVTSGLPPMLLLTGDADTEVRPKNTFHLATKLQQFQDPVAERVYKGVGHIGIILAFANGFRSKPPVLEDTAGFIREHTQKQ